MQNPMFIRQSLRKVVLLYFIVYPALEKRRSELESDRGYFFCLYIVEVYHAEGKVSVHIQMYFSHNSLHHPLIRKVLLA